MESRWVSVLFYGGMAGVATFLGMYLVLVKESWSRRNSAHLISFSAGTLLGVGFLHILPEALELAPNATLYLLLSFVIFYFLEHHLPFHADHEQLHHTSIEVPNSHDDCCSNPNPMGAVALAGMSLHSLIDGIIIGTGFELDSDIGFLAAVAVITHKIPAGVSMFSILLHYGYSKRTATAFTSAVALATPLGAVACCGILTAMGAGLIAH